MHPNFIWLIMLGMFRKYEKKNLIKKNFEMYAKNVFLRNALGNTSGARGHFLVISVGVGECCCNDKGDYSTNIYIYRDIIIS